jgi:hypothetical protein
MALTASCFQNIRVFEESGLPFGRMGEKRRDQHSIKSGFIKLIMGAKQNHA